MTGNERRANNRRFLSPWSTAARWGFSLVTAQYSLLLVLATHYPKPGEILGRHAPPDKLMHFVAYGVLGVLTTFTLRAFGRSTRQSVLFLAVGLAFAAALDEITQPLFSRHAEMLDWVFDCAGLGVGIATVLIFETVRMASRLGAARSTKLGVQNDENT